MKGKMCEVLEKGRLESLDALRDTAGRPAPLSMLRHTLKRGTSTARVLLHPSKFDRFPRQLLDRNARASARQCHLRHDAARFRRLKSPFSGTCMSSTRMYGGVVFTPPIRHPKVVFPARPKGAGWVSQYKTNGHPIVSDAWKRLRDTRAQTKAEKDFTRSSNSRSHSLRE